MGKRNLLTFVMLASVAPLSAHQRIASVADHSGACPHAHSRAARAQAASSDGLPVGSSLLDLSASSTFAP